MSKQHVKPPGTQAKPVGEVAAAKEPLPKGLYKQSFQHLPFRYEHPADTADATLKSNTDNAPVVPATSFIQRKCHHCEEEEKVQLKSQPGAAMPFIQKKEGDGSTAGDGVASQIEATRGGGNTMDDGTRSFMEERFGTDFSAVKIHTGDYAAQASRGLNAQAFTVGSDIYFNSGKYAPGSESGKHLLAHELTHTVQQKGNVVQPKIQRLELTYDDGPDANTQITLDALKKQNAKATFYLVGQKVLKGDNWKIVFDIAASGDWLGNHAFDWDFVKDDHIFLSGDYSERASKILQTEFAIRDALVKGKADAQAKKTWDAIPVANQDYINDVITSGTGRFRTPGFRSHFYSPGAADQSAAIAITNKILKDAGLRSLEISDSVSIDPKDWEKGKTQTDVEKSVTGSIKSDADSILLHSRLGISAAATPAILNDIKNKKLSYDAPARGTTSGIPGTGFSGVKTSAEWINSYYWVDKIGPGVTVNVTDPVDRTVTRQTGVAWIDYGTDKYLAVIHIENSSIAPGTRIEFLSFVNQDLRTKAISAATPNQPKGIQTIGKKFVIDAPDAATDTIAKM